MKFQCQCGQAISLTDSQMDALADLNQPLTCPQCGTSKRLPPRQQIIVPAKRRSRANDDDDPRHRRPTVQQIVVGDQRPREDPLGVMGIFLAIMSLVGTLAAPLTCGFSLVAVLPLAVFGLYCSYSGEGNKRVAGLLLNALCLVPAVGYAMFWAFAVINMLVMQYQTP